MTLTSDPGFLMLAAGCTVDKNIEHSFPSKQLGKEMALAIKKVKQVLLYFERFFLVNS